ncbi:MAG: ECF transporter S component [Acutalibacteraceae bacterium]|nr:ECF transporter S component [Acutalibacteraceae bacterium]
MKFHKIAKTVVAALFTALICVATFIVQIPSPATGGYVNLGDCFVLIAGIYLGYGYGALAAGLGSALADVLAGYSQYAPATFVVKALMAVFACLIFKSLSKKTHIGAKILGSLAAEIIMVGGYFAYEAVILKYGMAAAGSVVPNIIQGIAGIVAAFALSTALDAAIKRSKTLSDFFGKG